MKILIINTDDDTYYKIQSYIKWQHIKSDKFINRLLKKFINNTFSYVMDNYSRSDVEELLSIYSNLKNNDTINEEE